MSYARDSCKRCQGKGLICVKFRDGSPFLLAMCKCSTGQLWRRGGIRLVRTRMAVAEEHDVVNLEDLEDAYKPMVGQVFKG